MMLSLTLLGGEGIMKSIAIYVAITVTDIAILTGCDLTGSFPTSCRLGVTSSGLDYTAMQHCIRCNLYTADGHVSRDSAPGLLAGLLTALQASRALKHVTRGRLLGKSCI